MEGRALSLHVEPGAADNADPGRVDGVIVQHEARAIAAVVSFVHRRDTARSRLPMFRRLRH